MDAFHRYMEKHKETLYRQEVALFGRLDRDMSEDDLRLALRFMVKREHDK